MNKKLKKIKDNSYLVLEYKENSLIVEIDGQPKEVRWTVNHLTSEVQQKWITRIGRTKTSTIFMPTIEAVMEFCKGICGGFGDDTKLLTKADFENDAIYTMCEHFEFYVVRDNKNAVPKKKVYHISENHDDYLNYKAKPCLSWDILSILLDKADRYEKLRENLPELPAVPTHYIMYFKDICLSCCVPIED